MSAKKKITEAADEILKASIKSAHKDDMKGLKDADQVDYPEDNPDATKNPKKDYAKMVKKDTSIPTKDKGDLAMKKEDLELEEDELEEAEGEEEDDKKSDEDELEMDGEEEDEKEDDGEEEDEMEEEKFSFASMVEQKFKLDITKDITEMFTGSDFTDEFKEKAATIFEAALRLKIKNTLNEMAKVADEIVEGEVARIEEELSEQVDDFLKVVMSEWLEENQVAIENNLRAEIAEDFMQSIKNALIEHYIEVPDEKIDLVDQLVSKNEELEESLNEEIAEKTENYKYIRELENRIVFNETVKKHGLTLSQEEKLKELAEDLETDSAEKYGTKLNTLIENFVLTEEKKAPVSTLTENASDGVETKVVDSSVKALAESLTRRFSR